MNMYSLIVTQLTIKLSLKDLTKMMLRTPETVSENENTSVFPTFIFNACQPELQGLQFFRLSLKPWATIFGANKT